MSKSDPRKAIYDMAKALQGVFKDYTRSARKRAWKSLTSKQGKAEVDKVLVNTSRPLSRFRSLQFSEWLMDRES